MSSKKNNSKKKKANGAPATRRRRAVGRSRGGREDAGDRRRNNRMMSVIFEPTPQAALDARRQAEHVSRIQAPQKKTALEKYRREVRRSLSPRKSDADCVYRRARSADPSPPIAFFDLRPPLYLNRPTTTLPGYQPEHTIESIRLAVLIDQSPENVNQGLRDDVATTSVILNEIERYPALWTQCNDKQFECHWILQVIADNVYLRTGKLVTPPKVAKVFFRAKKELQEKLRTSIRELNHDRNETEVYLMAWPLYEHLRFLRPRLELFEVNHRADKNGERVLVVDGECDNEVFSALEATDVAIGNSVPETTAIVADTTQPQSDSAQQEELPVAPKTKKRNPRPPKRQRQEQLPEENDETAEQMAKKPAFNAPDQAPCASSSWNAGANSLLDERSGDAAPALPSLTAPRKKAAPKRAPKTQTGSSSRRKKAVVAGAGAEAEAPSPAAEVLPMLQPLQQDEERVLHAFDTILADILKMPERTSNHLLAKIQEKMVNATTGQANVDPIIEPGQAMEPQPIEVKPIVAAVCQQPATKKKSAAPRRNDY